ncbi:uncharacterized protein LOC133326383 [Musca vetustissima]|uniref:uncharacterized protein LOC133326383 n=1 Tax=Musca vetustissima TaxID=27455 RepID=UPI002AB7592D|nr:uncharacterized protein LOC133326383 [Musca vetustissima]
MKSFVAVLVICALAYTQAQAPAAAGLYPGFPSSFAGLSPAQFYQSLVLQKEAGKLLVRPDLPEDLRQRVFDTMARAEQSLNQCSGTPDAAAAAPGAAPATPTLPWVQIQCSALQMKIYKNQLKVIKSEANARAMAATATPAGAAAAPAF